MNAQTTTSRASLAGGRSRRSPTYLRVVVTARCNYHCSFCHMEGDPHSGSGGFALPPEELEPLLDVAVSQGVRKLKFLGGEPLLYPALPRVIEHVRKQDPSLDISVITAGGYPVRLLEQAFDAGLTRANLSIHGFAQKHLAANLSAPAAQAHRNEVLAYLLASGRPTKINYVYTGPRVRDDLGQLAERLQGTGAVLAVLDDLGSEIGADGVRAVLTDLLGPPLVRYEEPDPHSLSTERWAWPDLVVEIKNRRLGDLAPWRSCSSCPVRARCGEGIFALRLTHDGLLRPCLDRPELAVPLREVVRRGGVAAGRAAWQEAVWERW